MYGNRTGMHMISHLHQDISPWLLPFNLPIPIKSEPADHARIVRWLKIRLEHKDDAIVSAELSQSSPKSQFSVPTLRLPQDVRALIHRHVLLPANKQLHPYIKSWYDETTRNAVPLLQACRQIRGEAEDVLYGEAIFTVPKESKIDATGALQNWFEELQPRLRMKVRYMLIYGCSIHRDCSLLKYVAEEMDLERITCMLLPGEATRLNLWQPNSFGETYVSLWMTLKQLKRVLGRIKDVRLFTDNPDEMGLLPGLNIWIEGLTSDG